MIDKLIRFQLPLLALLIPIFFLPITPDFFGFNKTYLIYIFATLSLLLTSLKVIATKQLNLSLTPSAIPLFVLIALYITSSLIISPTRVVSLTNQTALFAAFGLIYLSLTTTKNDPESLKSINKQTIFYLCAGLIISSTVQLLSISKVFDLPNINGGPLPFLTLTIVSLPVLIFLAFKSKSAPTKITLFSAATLGLAATTAVIFYIIQNLKTGPLALLPYSAGWAIAVDTFKDIRTGLLGTGPNTYLQAFTNLRPASLNYTPVWNMRFTSSSSFFLTLTTTVGLPAAIAFLFMFFKPLLQFKSNKQAQNITTKALALGLFLSAATLILLPLNIILITLSFIFLILINLNLSSKTYAVNFSTKPFLGLLLTIPLLAVVAYFWLFAGRAYAAALYTYQALKTLNSDVLTSYNHQSKAYQLDPYNPTYRINFAQTSLALANTLAAKSDLSDQEKADISKLIQQAIREAKNATQVSPGSAIAWENLATTYRQLINFAQGSTDWAIASYLQAESLDPTNPRLKLDIGGLFLSLNDPQEAAKYFSRAVELKADWPNAHYNLAAAYKQNQSYSKALEQMRIVVQLVDPNSEDYQKASDELKELENLVAQNQAQTPQQDQGAQTPPENIELLTPTPIPSPQPETQIELPQDSAPQIPEPVIEEEPSASPSATP